jgi:hypothetical protein
MKKIASTLFVVMALTLVLSLPVLADPFSDVPQDHWAYDAVQMLEEKGLVEGYPDGLFKGDRAMTRYEMAMVVARVIAKLEQVQASIPEIPDLSIYATKQDLETINKLLKEYKDELDALGVRVNNIEETVGKLTARVEELERVKISGDFQSIANNIGIYERPSNAQDYGPGYPTTHVVLGDIDRFAGSTLIFNTQHSGALGPAGFSPVGSPPVGSAFWGSDSDYNTIPVGTAPLQTTVPDAHVPSARAGEPEFALNQGFALTSKLNLTITAKIADDVKAGGDLVAYSAFGDAAVYNNWGIFPQYNTLGSIAGGGANNVLDFQADLATLWFKVDKKDWKLNGEFGNFQLHNVSSNVFYGVRNPYFGFHDTDRIPLNGLNVNGKLYEMIDVEFFMAQDINTVSNGQSGIWFMQDPLDSVTTQFGVTPVDLRYRNYIYGVWAGVDLLENKALHVEGSIMRVYEDYASNPNIAYGPNPLQGPILSRCPQDQMNFGFKANYKFPDEWLTVYGEFAGTGYKADLINDVVNKRQYGYLMQIGAKGKMLDNKLLIYGEYDRTEANFDPFGYHKTWEREFDYLHDGYSDIDITGFGFAVRPGKFRPNRHGLDLGVTYKLAAGEIYGGFRYLQQVVPTAATLDSNDFNFSDNNLALTGVITGRPNLTVVQNAALGINAFNNFGNQDYYFNYNDPAKGNEMFVKVGGRYDFGGNMHLFGGWDYLKFKRDYTLTRDNGRYTTNGYTFTEWAQNQGNPVYGTMAVTDFSAHFTHLGVTYDVSDKFSVQGNFAYVKNSGVDDTGFNQDNSTIIPGVALKYDFNDTTSVMVDYKYYRFSDTMQTANDYSANKLVTRLNIKF